MIALRTIVGACNKYVKEILGTGVIVRGIDDFELKKFEITKFDCTMNIFKLFYAAVKKRLAGKRNDLRRRRVYAAADTTPVDELLQCNNYYDNEAVDNMINEFIVNKQKTTVDHQT